MLTRLGAETLVHHADADADVDRLLFQTHATSADYRTYLSRIYGTLVPLEAAFATTPGLSNAIDIESRAKSGLVFRDLSRLGMTRHEISVIRPCTTIPAFRSPAPALGWLYVIERPMLASSVILRHLATQLPNEMTDAAAYLSCYAGQTGSMWRELGLAMDRIASSIAIGDQIVAAAHEAFRTLHRWRMSDLRRPAEIRHVG